MKIFSKVILIMIIVIPVIMCVTTLNKIWSEDEQKDKNNITLAEKELLNGQLPFLEDEISGDETNASGESSGEKTEKENGEPVSKLMDATVAISVANVYTEANETSEIVGTLEKYAEVVAQRYSNGWSRVTNDTVSGWMKTENITFPEGGTLDTNTQVKTGKIKAEPYLNMRASANSSATVITTIPNGTQVTIQEEVTGWYKVTYASATGWISADYVIINK